MAWTAPLQMSLYLYFMYQEIGYAVFAGLVVFLVAVPLNIFIAKKAEIYQCKQMNYKDKRMDLMNEILGGIRVLKMYCWESSFIKRVQDIRIDEEKGIRKFAWINALSSVIFTILPYIALLVSFGTFVFMDDNHILTAEKAFVTLSYMGQMSMQIIALPMIIVSIIQANVSVQRVNIFLNSKERQPVATFRETNDRSSVQIIHGHFGWGRIDDLPSLKDINIDIKKGSLTAIIGPVGSGKSSLLSAILGEMNTISGIVAVERDVAYVSQLPWLVKFNNQIVSLPSWKI